MKKKIFITLMLALLLVFSMAPTAWAEELIVGKIVYGVSEDDGTAGVYGLADGANLGADGILDIPAKVTYGGTEYPVTTIGPEAFAVDIEATENSPNLQIKEVRLPETITQICNDAFYGCKNLVEINLPVDLQYIDTNAFCNCENLAHIELPADLVIIYSDAFANCTSLKEVTLPDNLTMFYANTFANCGNDSQHLTIKTRNINDYAKMWEAKSFGSDYANIDIQLLDTSGRLIITEEITDTNCRYLLYDDQAALLGFAGSEMADLTIPATVSKEGKVYRITNIAPDAFNRAGSTEGPSILTSVDLSAAINLQEIGETAFGYCSELTSIALPANLTSIGNYAFRSCTKLENLELPDSLTSIGREAFYECSALTSITLPASLTSIDMVVFADSGLTSVTFAEGCQLTEIPEATFYRTDLTQVNLPSSITKIGNGAFQGCDQLTKVELPAYLESIDANAFLWCGSLADIELPATLTSIGNSAFDGCRSLSSVNLPASLRSIGNGVFEKCSGLTSVTFADGCQLTEIPDNAFSNTGLSGLLKLPVSISNIGLNAFSNCTNLNLYITDDKLLNKISYNSFSRVPLVKCDTAAMYDYLTNGANKGATRIERLYRLADIKLTCDKPFYIYTGKTIEPEITVSITEKGQTVSDFIKDVDYTVTYENDIAGSLSAGTATVTATQDGRLLGSNSVRFAILNENQSMLQYYKNDGTDIISDHQQIANKGEVITLLETAPFAAPEGKTFKGYMIDGMEYTPGAAYIVPAPNATHEIKVLTVWQDTTPVMPEKYTVCFDANGGSGKMAAQELAPGAALTLPACTFTAPQGQEFKIWQIDGVDYAVDTTYTVKADTLVKAIWQNTDKPVDHYQISFELNGGNLSSDVTNPVYVAPDKEYKMPYATKSGYTLRHWAIGSTDSEYTVQANKTYTFTADTTVYAIWAKNSSGGHSNRPNTSGGDTDTTTTPGTTEKPGATTTSSTPSGQNTVTAHNINNVFADVANGAWYSEAVAYVYNNGIMNGTEKGFEPNASTTRAMLVTMLFRLENKPTGGTANFSDVASGQWFSEAIVWAASQGIVNGYENGHFGPNDAITREQLAVVLYRYAQLNGRDVSSKVSLSSFSDNTAVSGWAQEAMQWAVGTGIINGDNGALNPDSNATRAEVATMIMRYIEK